MMDGEKRGGSREEEGGGGWKREEMEEEVLTPLWILTFSLSLLDRFQLSVQLSAARVFRRPDL